jgi:hypothetical protein
MVSSVVFANTTSPSRKSPARFMFILKALDTLLFLLLGSFICGYSAEK